MFGRAVVPSCRRAVVSSCRRAVLSSCEPKARAVGRVIRRSRSCELKAAHAPCLVVPSCRPRRAVLSSCEPKARAVGRVIRRSRSCELRAAQAPYLVGSSCRPVVVRAEGPSRGPRQRRSRSCEQKAALSTICHLPCQRQYHCAERSLRRMRSSIQCASHHSTGFTI